MKLSKFISNQKNHKNKDQLEILINHRKKEKSMINQNILVQRKEKLR